MKKGILYFDDYFNSRYKNNIKLKQLQNYNVILPNGGTRANYGVYLLEENRKNNVTERKQILNLQLTRELFGASYDELNNLILIFYKLFFLYNEYLSLPRITRSNKKSNSCDLTELWIPQNFPYIKFEQSAYLYGHVSLLGFYKHLSFLLKDGKRSKLFKYFIENDISEELLMSICEISTEYVSPVYYKDI